MVKVFVGGEGGGSPVKTFLRDFNIAVAEGDLSAVEESLTEDVVWNLFEPSGQKRIHGRKAVLEEYSQNLVIVPREVVIETIIAQGWAGAVNGTIKAEDGRSYVFCDIYKLGGQGKGAGIKEMSSYIIEREEGGGI